jgi:minor extracellular serine protease Vpr
MKGRLLGSAAASALLVAMLPAAASARAPSTIDRSLPDSVATQKLDKPMTSDSVAAKLDTSLAGAKGRQRVFVDLSRAPAASLATHGGAAQRAQVAAVRAQHSSVIGTARRLDSKVKVLGQTERATNVVAFRIDASQLKALARDPNVVAIHPVRDYELALSETVPYIGATAVQQLGFTGKGIRVGVIDSGIDYTHAEFGGPGTVAAYEAAYGTSNADPKNTTLDGLFPTAKVVGGYDFVGEDWPNTPEAPDPDPIDFEGHGTHVADIIAGAKGVAPDASLYAYKVCSSVSTSCSGVALIEAMDAAVDPNGDGATNDHLDVVNMSLGVDYGSAYEDDLAAAVDAASKLGMLTVAAAGNGGDKPYIAGTPANALSAISVAQTQVPSAVAFPLVVDSPASIAGVYTNTETVDWAPIGNGFTGDVAYVGQGCPAGSIDGQPAADPYLADPAGKVALIDRGACNISLKVDRAAKAGATAVLLGLVAPGDAVSFSKGGGDTFVPTMVIQQSLSQAIQANIAAPVHVSVSDAVSIPLVGSMVGSSARGPSTPYNTIKPDIGAPGASVSAVVGTGTGTEAFGGTSGATPMVTGSAALLRQAFPHRSIAALKAVLMNTAETDILNNAANTPGYLAPITRIGGGEVRVDRALESPAAAWEKRTKAGSLSFGFVDASARWATVTRKVIVRNYTGHAIRYAVTPTFRYADDVANGAVKVHAPGTVLVPAHDKAQFKVRVVIDGAKLRAWTLDSGPNALNARLLDTLEYDGYVKLDRLGTSADDQHPLHLAWQVLPRLSGNVDASRDEVTSKPITSGDFAGLSGATTILHNRGVGTAAVDAYSLVGRSPKQAPAPRGGNVAIVDLKALGVQTFPVPAGYCSDNDSFVYAFAVSTWERQTIGAFPDEFDIFLDTDQDGTPDYVVFNAALSGLADARELTWVQDLHATDPASAFFFADNGTNDSNTILYLCGEQIGMDATNFGQQMDVSVVAGDNFFSGLATDSIDGITVAPLGERYFGVIGSDGLGSGDIAPFSSAPLTVLDFGPSGTNPGEKGVMLVLNASRGDTRGGAPKGNEELSIRVH